MKSPTQLQTFHLIDEINGDMIEEIHKKFLEFPAEKLGGEMARVRENMEITAIIKQWRLSLASRNGSQETERISSSCRKI